MLASMLRHRRHRACLVSFLQASQPDAVVLGAGSWDVLHKHDPAALAADAAALHAVVQSIAKTPLCASSKVQPPQSPAVVWVRQPRPVTSRLSSVEKRLYLTPEAVQAANAALSPDASPFNAVADLFYVSGVCPRVSVSVGMQSLWWMSCGCGAQ
jgi:hypothetical protein